MAITKKNRKNKVEYADPIVEIETRVDFPETPIKVIKPNRTVVIPDNVNWTELFSRKVEKCVGFSVEYMPHIDKYADSDTSYVCTVTRDKNNGYICVHTNIIDVINRIKEYYGEHPDDVMFRTIEIYADGEYWDVIIKDVDELFVYDDTDIDDGFTPKWESVVNGWADNGLVDIQFHSRTIKVKNSFDFDKSRLCECNTTTITTTDDKLKERIMSYACDFPEKVKWEKCYNSSNEKRPKQVWIVKIKGYDFITYRVK